MASFDLLFKSLFVYLLLFFQINLVFTISDYYFYEIDPIGGGQSSILPANFHRLEKRSIDPKPLNNETKINDTTSSPPPPPPLPSKNKSTKLTKTSSISPPLPPSVSTTMPSIMMTTIATTIKDSELLIRPTVIPKLLGVNGTGQRKIVPTPRPIVVVESTVMPTLLHNDTLVNHFHNDTIQHNDDVDDDISISKFSVSTGDFEKTLPEHNITDHRMDDHIYYKSLLNIDNGQAYWVDLSNRSDTKINELLSKSHRRAATVKLSFDFPFYGHLIKNVTIATGGFLYTGDYVHSWLAATQYIAPLMANFDTSISNDSFIRYSDNGTSFTVEWDRVSLQDKPKEGEFTFQATLHKTGDIVFVYKNVPDFINEIKDDHHPVKIGLSDAYIIDRTIFFVRRKTIYEYHRVNFAKEDIKNWTVVYLKALPTCLDNKDCNTCTTRKIPPFKCVWCPGVNRCSNGVDRGRQEWLMKGCDKKQIMNETMCTNIDNDKTNLTNYTHDTNELHEKYEDNNYDTQSSRIYDNLPLNNNAIHQPVNKMGVSGIVATLFLLSMVAGIAVWIFYAYRNPHTTSGQILIRYRPSQWRWKRGEARYTAATIHM